MKSKELFCYCLLAAPLLPSALTWRPCRAFAPSPMVSSRPDVRSIRLCTHSRRRPNQWSPIYYRDREIDEESFTNTVQASNDVNKHSKQLSASASSLATGFSFNLIRSICFSQAAMLLLASAAAAGMLRMVGSPVDLSTFHWNAGSSFTSFWDFTVTPFRVFQGVLSTLPMLALGTMVENSDRRDASHVNFSTTNMVVSLFGRRHNVHKNEQQQSATTSTSTALFWSFFIALFTGVSEEIVFRGYLPTAIFSESQSVLLALLGQAAIFGLGHVHKNATSSENKLVSGLQFVNGIWQGLVYLLTGGDLLPCIIAHALYDMHVFVETWKRINDQMDWTALAVGKSLPDNEEWEVRQLQMDIGPENLSGDTIAFCRRFFYAFDYEHRGTLSLRDVQRAISYAFLRDKVVPTEEQVRQAFHLVLENRAFYPGCEERLRLPDFLKLLFAFKAQAQSQVAITRLQ